MPPCCLSVINLIALPHISHMHIFSGFLYQMFLLPRCYFLKQLNPCFLIFFKSPLIYHLIPCFKIYCIKYHNPHNNFFSTNLALYFFTTFTTTGNIIISVCLLQKKIYTIGEQDYFILVIPLIFQCLDPCLPAYKSHLFWSFQYLAVNLFQNKKF